MNTIVFAAAAAALVLGVAGFLPADAWWPASFEPVRNAALVAMAALIMLRALRAAPAKAQVPVATAAPSAPSAPQYSGEALMLLSMLQEKGRFLDFVAQDIGSYSDSQVAAASRVVQQGCAAVIREVLTLAPAHPGNEGQSVTIERSDDLRRYRLLGKVANEPPYTGKLLHRGWKTTRIELPRYTQAVEARGENLISPIEVEIR